MYDKKFIENFERWFTGKDFTGTKQEKGTVSTVPFSCFVPVFFIPVDAPGVHRVVESRVGVVVQAQE